MSVILIPLNKKEANEVCKSELDKSSSLMKLPSMLKEDIIEIYKESTGIDSEDFVYGLRTMNSNSVDLERDYKSVSSYLNLGSLSFVLDANIRDDRTISIDFMDLIDIKRKYKNIVSSDEFVMNLERKILKEELEIMIRKDNKVNEIVFMDTLKYVDIMYFIIIDTNWDYDVGDVRKDASSLQASCAFS